ncbi:hypothetical protein PMAYCL1PPCAC_14249, partial [Pristionchus mayeri]
VSQKIKSSSKRISQSIKVSIGAEDSKQIETEKEKNELECPECNYRTRNVSTWIKHLRAKHSTSPTQAGCLLRCDCGHESYSRGHSCEIANFTVIFTGRPIRRLSDPAITPQCVLCEKYPKTPCGYTHHLQYNHKTTLSANGMFLLCSCGTRYISHHGHEKHDKKCTGREFTLHKVEED